MSISMDKFNKLIETQTASLSTLEQTAGNGIKQVKYRAFGNIHWIPRKPFSQSINLKMIASVEFSDYEAVLLFSVKGPLGVS